MDDDRREMSYDDWLAQEEADNYQAPPYRGHEPAEATWGYNDFGHREEC